MFKQFFRKGFTAEVTTENNCIALTGSVIGSNGAVGDSIVKLAPEFGPIERLHLASTKDGSPLHSFENGEYYLKKGDKLDAALSCLGLTGDFMKEIESFLTEDEKAIIARSIGKDANLDSALLSGAFKHKWLIAREPMHGIESEEFRGILSKIIWPAQLKACYAAIESIPSRLGSVDDEAVILIDDLGTLLGYWNGQDLAVETCSLPEGNDMPVFQAELPSLLNSWLSVNIFSGYLKKFQEVEKMLSYALRINSRGDYLVDLYYDSKLVNESTLEDLFDPDTEEDLIELLEDVLEELADVEVEEVEHQQMALAAHLGCSPVEIDLEEYPGYPTVYQGEGSSYKVLTDDEATEAASDDMLETLWAFNPNFLADYAPEGVTEEVFELLQEQCEGANDAIKSIIGNNLEDMFEAAICADGRGHFLNRYDGTENEVVVLGETWYIYQEC